MPARQLWIGVPIALASWLACCLAAGDAPVLRPGETVRAEMPAGDPDTTSVVLELVATEDGPLTVETSTLYFDTLLKVFDVNVGEEAKPLAEDDDGGVGWNSRLTFQAAAGRSYRVEVRTAGEDWGGRLEVSALVGRPPASSVEEQRERAAAYFGAVAAEAEQTGSSILGADALLGRATLYHESGDYAEARRSYEAALERFSQAGAPAHPRAALALGGLATILRGMGEYAAVRPLLERSLAISEKAHGPEHLETARHLEPLGELYWAIGDYAAARPLLERRLAIVEKARGSAPNDDMAEALSDLGNMLRSKGDYAAARPLLERALAVLEMTHGPEHLYTALGLNNLAELLLATGEPEAARQLLERALTIVEKAHGPEHPDTARGLNRLAALLVKVSDYAAARRLYERALAITEKVSGPEHLETARGLDALASLLQTMGEYATARPLLVRTLEIVEKVRGPEHPDTAAVLDHMGAMLTQMGAYAAARPLLERALAIQEKVLGPEHPGTARGLNSLAELLQTTGEYAAARPLYERALAISEKGAGPEHPATADKLNNLARLLATMGEHATARPLYERALAISEKTRGPEHPVTSTFLKNLADLFVAMGEYAAARPLYERALAIDEKTIGPEHSRTAWGLMNLAEALRYLGEYTEARRLSERALAIKEKTVGPEHADTAAAVNGLALVLQSMGEYAAARPLYERALAVWEKTLGEHPYTAASLNNLAWLLRDMGEYAAARPLLERALAIVEKSLGPEHPRMSWSLTNLGDTLRAMGEYAAARPLYERALAIDEKALGPEQAATSIDLKNLGDLFLAMGEYAAARPLFERALAIDEKVLGPEHTRTAWGLRGLADLHRNTGEYAAARPLYERALAIDEKVLGPEHPSTARGLRSVAELHRNMGDYAAARPLFERALAINERVLGHDHPAVALNLSDLARLSATGGETADALDQALEAERIGREHLQMTGRSLAEREALRYAAVRRSGLDLALTLAAGGLEPGQRRRALDAIVRSRALVLDGMAARHRATGGSADPAVVRLAEHLASRRSRLARLVVRGPGDQKPETYRQLLDDARKEKEDAERALAESSAAFARELSRGRQGLDEVAASLPEASALVAFSQYRRIDLSPRSPASGSTVEDKPVPSYLAFVLRAGSRDPEVVDLGKAAGIDEAVSRWKKEASRGALPAGDPSLAETRYREAGAALRRKTWDPLAAAIGDARRVFVVPDGSLNLVSVATLPVDEGGYLIERGPVVHYVSAERDLVPAGKVRSGTGLLALGGPSYDATEMFAALRKGKGEAVAKASKSHVPILLASAATYRGQRAACGDFSTLRFERLPATSKETREVVRLWQEHGATDGESAPAEALDLRDAAASETALKRSAPGRRVLHLATHGFFLGGECESALDRTRGIGGLAEASAAKPDAAPPPVTGENPLVLSGLALAGANHRQAAGEGEDDGILTAEEIASLDLSGVEWAVLSACETGLGDVRVGEGVFGLRRAFQVAGAGTLIMSLWSVDDESTREWMKALYEGRLGGQLDTAEAVRRASLTALERRREAGESTHPFYWGAFVAAGDWK